MVQKLRQFQNVGNYTVAADGTVTFVPENHLSEQHQRVTVVREDMNGNQSKRHITPTVTPVKPFTADPATSTGISKVKNKQANQSSPKVIAVYQ